MLSKWTTLFKNESFFALLLAAMLSFYSISCVFINQKVKKIYKNSCFSLFFRSIKEIFL